MRRLVRFLLRKGEEPLWEVLLRSELRFGTLLRAFFLGVGLTATWLRFGAEVGRVLFPRGMLLYVGLSLAWALTLGLRALPRQVGRWALLAAYALDVGFVSYLVFRLGGATSDLYLLYGLLALKAAIYYPFLEEVLVVAYTVLPAYVLALYGASDGFFFLLDPGFFLRYALLFALVGLSTYAAWLMEFRQRRIAELYQTVEEKTRDLEQKSEVMARTARELGDRVLQLRSLQEGIKAINAALTLEDVLRLIASNASQVLGGTECSVALLDEEEDRLVILATSRTLAEGFRQTTFRADEGVAGWVVMHGQPVLINDCEADPRYVRRGPECAGSIMSVPLLVDGRTIGALNATSPRKGAFSAENLALLGTFADQAAVAVKNARLYRDVWEKRNELEAVLQGIGDGVVVADTRHRVALINPVARRIFHLEDLSEVEGLHVASVDPQLHDLLRETTERGEHLVREIVLPGPREGEERVYQALSSIMLDAEGRLQGVVAVLRDVTGQKELERMKSNFLSVVSHELKTPLHSIKGFVDIILLGKAGPVTEVQRDFLETVRQQTAALQNLINDLLEFSRLEAGQVRLRLEPVSLGEVAATVVEKLEPLARQGEVALHNRIPSDLAPVEGDRMRLEQVLTNLVDNAIKFTPSGGQVTLEAQDLGEAVQVWVHDTGIGIPPEERERVFDRFYQVDSGSTRPYRGTGLGLSICKHIVERHQGRIWIEDREGPGTTFTFVLPKELEREEGEPSLDFTTPRPRPRKEKGRAG
ncbi:MAG: ATP-binding protein [Anaerolineae bacterium]